jgi:hypothetical protein
MVPFTPFCSTQDLFVPESPLSRLIAHSRSRATVINKRTRTVSEFSPPPPLHPSRCSSLDVFYFNYIVFFRTVSKVKLVMCYWTPHHEGILGEWRYSSTLSLTSVLEGGEWSASCFWPLYSQGKSPWHPLDRRLGGPQISYGRGGEKENSQPPLGIEHYNSNLPALSPVLWMQILTWNTNTSI